MTDQTRAYREGDLIRATKGDTSIQGPLTRNTVSDGGFTVFDAGWPIASLLMQGWTIELIERATATLPTEPGLYRDNEGDYWTLKDDGKWYLDSDIDSTNTVRNYMPFTRLYTREEVTKLIRKAAYAVDPDYEYDNRAAQFVTELEATL